MTDAPKGRWAGVVALFLVVIIAYVDRVNVSVLIVDPAFLQAFGLTGDRAAQGSLMTLFLIGYGVASLFVTPLYEAFLGYRRGLLVSMLLWPVLTAISPLAGSLVMLLFLRIVLGAAEGPLFSLKVMYVRDHFAAAERGKPNAVSSMGVSLGLAVGFPLVSVLLRHYGWGASFYALAAINLFIGLPLIYVFIHPAAQGASPPPRISVADTFRGALKMKHLGAILLIEIFTLAYLWGSSSWLPAYLIDDKGFSLQRMGWVSSLPFIIGVGASLLGGMMVDWLPPRLMPLIFTGGGLFCAASVLALTGSETTVTTLLFLLLASICWGVQGAAIPTLIQRYSPAQSVGSAYGIINGVGNMVAAFMPMAMGGMMTHAVSGGFLLLVISQIGVALCGAWLALRQIPDRAAAPATTLAPGYEA